MAARTQFRAQRELFIQRFARTCALISLILGLLVVAGWLLQVPLLTGKLFPNSAPARPGGVMVVLCVAIALWCRYAVFIGRPRWLSLVADCASVLALWLCLESLGSHVLHVTGPLSLWLRDILLGSDSPIQPYLSVPGALGGFLLALAQLGLGRKWVSGHVVGLLCLPTILISSWAIFELLLQIGFAGTLNPFGTVALILLAMGTVLLRPAPWLSELLLDRGPVGKLAWLLPFMVIVPALIGAIPVNLEKRGLLNQFIVDEIFILLLAATVFTIFCVVVDMLRSLERRLAAEDKLREEERRSKLIVETTHDGIVMVGPDNRFVFTNPRMEAMLGYGKDELIGLPGEVLFRPEAVSHLGEVRQRIREGLASSYEMEMQRKDGALIWVLVTAQALHGEAGAFAGTVASLADITHLKAAQAELREQALRYQTIVESSHDGIFLSSPGQQFVYVNPRAEEMLGYEPGELVGQRNDVLRQPQDLQSLEEVRRRLKEGNLQSYELQAKRKDGSLFWALFNVKPMFAAEGEYRGSVATMADIDHLKQAQAEVLREGSRLRAILETASDAIITIDDQGQIQTANHAVEAMFGYAPHELQGQPLMMLTPEKNRADYVQFLEEYQQTGITRHGGIGRTLEGRRRSGDVFPLEITMSGFTLENRRYYTAIIRDETERAKLENQLRQSQKLEGIGKLAGGVAHDFNNMLTVIIAYSQMSIDELPPGPVRENIVEVLNAGERAALITQQLLAFSRQQVLSPKVLSLNRVVVDMEKMLRRLIGEHIKIATKLDASVGDVLLDQGQIVQVLMNLAVNARDAMPSGGTLTIETQPATLDATYIRSHEYVQMGPHVLLSVSDTGTGMPPEVQARIFEPFYTTKELGAGTGLGLSTVYGIVKQSRGSIEVYSEQGVGTTFKLYFPLAEQAQEAEGQAATQILRGTETILVAEDDPAVRRAAVLILESLGYRVLATTNGREAVELVQQGGAPIQLFLTDLIMPELGGREAAEEIGGLLPTVRILFMSGYTDDAVIRTGLVTDQMAFLQKPFNPVSLGSKVREVLDEARA